MSFPLVGSRPRYTLCRTGTQYRSGQTGRTSVAGYHPVEPPLPFVDLSHYGPVIHSNKAELVENITEDIPVNEGVMIEISKHAAGHLFANSNIDGGWRFADRTLLGGCEEAAKKRFNLASYRQMAQADPNPRI